MNVHSLDQGRVALVQDFGTRLCNALGEYRIVEELECVVVITAMSGTACVRLERGTDEGIDYIIEHVAYSRIEDVGDRAYEAADMANKLLAALLLKEGATWAQAS